MGPQVVRRQQRSIKKQKSNRTMEEQKGPAQAREAQRITREGNRIPGWIQE